MTRRNFVRRDWSEAEFERWLAGERESIAEYGFQSEYGEALDAALALSKNRLVGKIRARKSLGLVPSLSC